MKTKEELNEIKRELEAVSEKVKELTEEELEQVTGGAGNGNVIGIGDVYGTDNLFAEYIMGEEMAESGGARPGVN